MAETKIFKCAICGNILELLIDHGGVPSCCGSPAAPVTANTVDAVREKHVPVVEKIAGGYKVTVGSVLHPMEEKHSIMWIELIAGNVTQRKFLKPGEQPAAEFKTDAATAVAREYCNLHGLWKAEA